LLGVLTIRPFEPASPTSLARSPVL
jgi:hypothetical protein